MSDIFQKTCIDIGSQRGKDKNKRGGGVGIRTCDRVEIVESSVYSGKVINHLILLIIFFVYDFLLSCLNVVL